MKPTCCTELAAFTVLQGYIVMLAALETQQPYVNVGTQQKLGGWKVMLAGELLFCCIPCPALQVLLALPSVAYLLSATQSR